MPTIGVSLISLLPGAYLFKTQASRIIEEVDGLDGLQIVPLGPYGQRDYARLAPLAISYEGVWNEGVKRGFDTDPGPTLLDWFLFWRGEVWGTGWGQVASLVFGRGHDPMRVFGNLYPDAIRVSHELDGNGVLELHPELRGSDGSPLTVGKIVDLLGPFCIDTWHLIRPGRSGESPICPDTKSWNWLISRLVNSGRVRLIHVQPPRDNPNMLKSFRNGKKCLLGDALKSLAGTSCPVIIETKPGMVDIVGLLKDMVKQIKIIMD